jgi:hypothetical protein
MELVNGTISDSGASLPKNIALHIPRAFNSWQNFITTRSPPDRVSLISGFGE